MQWLLSLLFGQLPGIVRELAQARVDLSKTQNERERIAAEERIKILEARKDALQSMNVHYFVLILLILTPFIFYLWWIIGYDKIVCPRFFVPSKIVCSTDPLSPWLEGILASIVALLTLKKA